MSSITTEIWDSVKDSDTPVEELEEELAELNKEIDWCLSDMFEDFPEEKCGCRRCSGDNNE